MSNVTYAPSHRHASTPMINIHSTLRTAPGWCKKFHSQYHLLRSSNGNSYAICTLSGCVGLYIHTRHSQYRDVGCATAVKTIGIAVKAACQGRLPAYHFGHACHKFTKENAEPLVVTGKETGFSKC